MDSLSDMAESFVVFFLPAIPKLLQVGGDGGVQLRGLGLLLAQRRSQALHFFREWLAVVLGGFGADVAAGGEDVAVFADVVQRCGLTETGDVLIWSGFAAIVYWIPAFAGMTALI